MRMPFLKLGNRAIHAKPPLPARLADLAPNPSLGKYPWCRTQDIVIERQRYAARARM